MTNEEILKKMATAYIPYYAPLPLKALLICNKFNSA